MDMVIYDLTNSIQIADRSSYPLHPDCGIQFYKKGPNLSKFLSEWEKETEKSQSEDDQGPLKKVLRSNPFNFTLARLATSMSMRFRPAHGMNLLCLIELNCLRFTMDIQ